MKNWAEWIIPVIVVTVWILNAVMRSREKEEPVRKPRGKSPDGSDRRAPASDIDRFLQEIERLRKQPAEPKPEPPKAKVPRVRPAGQQPPRVRAAPTRVALRPVEAIPVAVERNPARISLMEPAAPSPITTPPAPRQSSPALAAAMALLASPKSAASAMILHEVFGPPKCRKSR